MDLMELHFHKNHHVTYDIFFTSPALMYDLLDKSTNSTGTVIKTRNECLQVFALPLFRNLRWNTCKNQGWGDGHSLGRQKSSLLVKYHWFTTVHTCSHALISNRCISMSFLWLKLHFAFIWIWMYRFVDSFKQLMGKAARSPYLQL